MQKKTKKPEKNKGRALLVRKETTSGITLIALIITIIVMLILVAVVVRTAINSGLFGHAKNATKGWADAQEQEANIGDNVDEILSQYRKNEHNWQRNGDDISCTHCNLSFVIGDYVDYKPDATSKTVTVTKEEAGLLEVNRYSNDTIDPASVEDQIFTQDTETYWQVLGVEDSDENGTNETLLIKMAFGTSTELTLKGAAAYNNGPDIMNRIAKELYSSSKYGEARSINVTDVNNTLQYTPGGGFYYASGEQELDGFNTQMKDIPTWNTVKSYGTYTPDGTNTEEKLGSYKVDGYYYVRNEEGTGVENPATGNTTNITDNTRDIVFITSNGEPVFYWLACRGVGVDDDCAIFGPGAVGDGGVYSFSDTFGSVGGVDDYGLPVCPVVSLKSEIPAKITPVFEEGI